MRTAPCLLALVLAVGIPAAGHAQDHDMMNMDGMTMGGTASSGDPDVDFAEAMIVHHKGAIDMAKTELDKGKDPEMRKLAEDIIKAQDTEIAFMNAWLSKRKQK